MIRIGDGELILPTLAAIAIVAIRLRKPIRGADEGRLAVYGDGTLLLASGSRALVDGCRTKVTFSGEVQGIWIDGRVVHRVVEQNLGNVVIGEIGKDHTQVIHEIADCVDYLRNPGCSFERIVAGQMVDAVHPSLRQLLTWTLLDEFTVSHRKEGPRAPGTALRHARTGVHECRGVSCHKTVED